MVENPNWQEVYQLAIYKRDRGVELSTTENNTSCRSLTSRFQLRHPNHLATLPPTCTL